MDLGQLHISVEDKFIIIQLNAENNLLPSGGTLNNFAYVLSSFSKDYKIIFDFRNVRYITSDLIYFIDEFEFFHYDSQVLLEKETLQFFKEKVNPNITLLTVNNFETKFEEHELDLTIFVGENTKDLNFKKFTEVLDNLTETFKGIPDEEEFNFFNNREGFDNELQQFFYKNYEDYLYFCKLSNSGIHLGTELIIGRRFLNDYFKRIGRNSLLSQYTFSPNRDGSFLINTYQSNSINNIEANKKLIKGKPYVHSSITYSLHQKALLEFQNLINKKRIKESELQIFLENNPIFLESLGYKTIRPQIVLEKDDGTSLRPDFLLEPIGDEWWDILDIKLPHKKIVITSGRDRYKFSESINELQAQLREYAAYFENEKYSKRIEDKYGIKCYKPKMIGIIGNDFNGEDERQVRRLITSYSDLKIIPFNNLHKICKERILI